MLFERFLKKKTRPAAEPKEAPERLLELARDHHDPAVRRDAVRRLASLPELRAVLAADGDLTVREIAFARYRSLIAGNEPGDTGPAERLAEVAGLSDPRTLEYLAREAADAEVRRAAIERIADPRILTDCALRDALAANRSAAVARIEERPFLEQIARQIGKKDKAVYRAAREKLRRHNEQEAEPLRIRARCLDLCERAERLGLHQQWTQDRALLEHLDRQWAEVAARAEPALEARFAAARARFLAAEGAWHTANAAQAAALEAREEVRTRREALIAEAAGLAALETEAALREVRGRLTAEWQALGTLPEAEQRALEARFGKHLEAAEARGRTLGERRRQRDRLRSSNTRAEQFLQESKPLDLPQTRNLIAQGRALAVELAQDPDATAEAAAFAELAQRLEARLKSQHRHAEQRLAELPERIEALAALVEAGELRKADPIHQSLLAALDLIEASGLPKDATATTATRLRELSPRLRDLQHWRRWGANQHREALCAAMEALREEDLPLAAVAERLHVLKTDWQEVDRSGSPASKPAWERFHRAATAVGERVRPLLAAQAAEQEGNRTARERVCRELEDFLARIDWARVDWKRVLHAEREVRNAWAAIGPCEPRERRRLERRFHQALSGLDDRLEAERTRNQAHKRELIERVRTLAEHPDLETAINDTKECQRRWFTTVPARQRDENRLWHAFREACDAVFERRTALHQAHQGELTANLRAREALCEEALALAEAATDPRLLGAALRDLDERWRDGEALPLPRAATAALNRRWQQAREQIRSRRQALEDAAGRAVLEQLVQRATLCAALEQSLLDPAATPADPEAAARAWERLPELPDRHLQEALEARHRTALEAAADPGRLGALRGQCDANAGVRSGLCLELEIAAGVESPPALAQERLRLQVNRLAEHMSEGESDRLRGPEDILRAWYLLGPAPHDADLEARVNRVRQALAAGPITPAEAEA